MMLGPISLLGFPLILWIVQSLRTRHYDPREPIVVTSRIPVMGHVIGFFTQGLEYLTQISLESGCPIFTLDMLLSKVYVVTSPRLVPAVRQSHRTMSFEPLFLRVEECVSGITGPGLDLLLGSGSKNPGLSHHTAQAMRPGLLGNGLDQINAKMVNVLASNVEDIALQKAVPSDLFAWCRYTMTVAATAAVYGEGNPYESANFREAFWSAKPTTMDVESNVIPLLLGIAPSLVGRTGRKAREYMTQRLIRYYEEGGHLRSSMLTYDRWKTQIDAGASVEDIARHEIPTGIGILSNTVPTCFWAIFDIYSRPALLSEIRKELVQYVVKATPNKPCITIDLADIRNKCPLLLSSYQETLRVRSRSAQIRVIQEDTLLDDCYLLKAGSILVVPSAVINRSKSVWGEDADQSNPRRFIEDEQDYKQKARGFLSFGMAPHLCMGRYFATGEILGLTALLRLRFDLSPVLGSWVEPRKKKSAVLASTGVPSEPFNVILNERKDFQGLEWIFHATPGKAKHGLVSG
ncbi:cytochrome P450 [Aspergillus bertholletiae]|uniref:Cytochrome P450 n=1 Tax=Aspergillus bertholletiae TaxID=1226010 RepID=A0A5N7BHH1_9EURO|nr:cytochrome P450 [Aspergillus bertholletiae]